MKRFLKLLSLLTVLSFFAAAVELSAAGATTVITGMVKVFKEKSGKVSMVTVQYKGMEIPVPSGSIGSFVPYDNKTVKVCCAVSDKTVVPICVTGLVQAQSVPKGIVH